MGNGDFRPLAESTPLTDYQKILIGDYVDDPYTCAKFGAHPSTEAPERMGEI